VYIFQKQGFPDMSKFYLLSYLALTYLGNFGDASFVYHLREENMLVGSITKLIAELLNFGFLSSVDLFRELLPVLLNMLEGRNDMLKMDIFNEPVVFSPPKSRFKMSSYSPLITHIKVIIIALSFFLTLS
jgi:hypothetical protein